MCFFELGVYSSNPTRDFPQRGSARLAPTGSSQQYPYAELIFLPHSSGWGWSLAAYVKLINFAEFYYNSYVITNTQLIFVLGSGYS
jgi:hypothetical protein